MAITKRWYQFKFRRDHAKENCNRRTSRMTGSLRSEAVITEFTNTLGSPVSPFMSKLDSCKTFDVQMYSLVRNKLRSLIKGAAGLGAKVTKKLIILIFYSRPQIPTNLCDETTK